MSAVKVEWATFCKAFTIHKPTGLLTLQDLILCLPTQDPINLVLAIRFSGPPNASADVSVALMLPDGRFTDKGGPMHVNVGPLGVCDRVVPFPKVPMGETGLIVAHVGFERGQPAAYTATLPVLPSPLRVDPKSIH